MEWTIAIVFLLFSSNGEAAAGMLACGSEERIISLDASLTPPDMIVASSEFDGYEAENVLNFGIAGDRRHLNYRTWCASTEDSDPHITISFTDPVIITGMISSGTKEDRGVFVQEIYMWHVTNFTLELAGNDSMFIPYATDTESPKYFESREMNTLIRFEDPILAEGIRLRPIEWYMSIESEDICQEVAIFGCLQSEAFEISDPTVVPYTFPETSTEASTSTPMSTEPKDETNTDNAQTVAIIVGDDQTLTIALPTAILTIIIVGIIASMGVVLCLLMRKRHHGEVKAKHHYENDTLVRVTSTSSAVRLLGESAVYSNIESEREELSRGGTIRVADNELYEDAGRNLEGGSTSVDATYEPINPVEQTMSAQEHSDSLMDNLAYSPVAANSAPVPNLTDEEISKAEEYMDMALNESYNPISQNDGDRATPTGNIYEEM